VKRFWYNTGVTTVERSAPLRLESRPARVLAIDAAGFLFGVALLTGARFVPQLISPLAFWLLFAALAAAFGSDGLRWLLRGVRRIELDGDTLTLRTGIRRASQRIERAEVRAVRARRGWGGQAVVLKIGGRSGRRRIVLRDDAFVRTAFAGLVERLAAWEG
jgi:hypothetical protein